MAVIMAKFRKLGGKVSITEKIDTSSIETTSTRCCYGFKITGRLRTAYLSRLSLRIQQKTILPSFVLECSQDPLGQNLDDFGQPHLQEYFHGNYTHHLLFKDQHLIFSTSYTPET